MESAMSMRSLQPQIKAIQQRYAGDQVYLKSLFFYINPKLSVNYLLELVFCNHGACFVLLTRFNSFVYLQERIQLETARLYKLAGINPLAGTYVSQFVVALTLISYKVIEAFVDTC